MRLGQRVQLRKMHTPKTRADLCARERSLRIGEGVPSSGPAGILASSPVPWKISPRPFPVRPETVARLEVLGHDLLALYKAANRMHIAATRGNLPGWILDYLDQGKPERIRELGNLRRTRSHVPRIIRPDLMALEDGTLRATEIDAVPGGFGMLAALSQRYASLGFEPVGDVNGIPVALAQMFRDVAGIEAPTIAIVVSDESEDYRSEMLWIAEALQELSVDAHVVHPRDLSLEGDALCFKSDKDKTLLADVVYRFFELYDLPNIPKVDLIIYAMKHRLITITPPFKAFLEEKSTFALFQHPDLSQFWMHELGKDIVGRLRNDLAPTWVLDPSPVPPFATVDPPLITAGRQVRNWSQLKNLSQRERHLVIKPSGFSELAWGARGVTVGHDVSADKWQDAVEHALGAFGQEPHVIQPYEESRRVPISYFDFEANESRQMDGRARVSPFYIVSDDEATLAGILITVVPSPNKVIHGTPEAVIAPAVVADDAVI